MKTSARLIFFISVTLTSCGRPNTGTAKNVVSFDSLISRLKEYNHGKDSFKLPTIYRGETYKVTLSDIPISINLADTVLKTAFGNKYPLSYSIIYQDNLIALFEPGDFICYKLPSFERNAELENKLNTKKFEYHWLLDNKLIGQSDNQHYFFNSNSGWEIYPGNFPLKKQPKLFEDEKYIICFDCHGEWGGTIYFFNKASQKIYFMEASCANTIIKRDDKYFVLSKLGHMGGSSDMKVIENPDKLSMTSPNKVSTPFQGQALGYADSSKQAKNIFDFYGIQTFSSFRFMGKTLYLTNWRQTTFLSEISDNTISIVNPLFNDDLYTHQPVTTVYGERTLINLDFYGIAGEMEVSTIIIEGNKLTRIDWNEKHNSVFPN